MTGPTRANGRGNLVDRPTMPEVLADCLGLIDALPEAERRQVMAALGARYGLKVSDPAQGAPQGRYHPSPRRGR